MKIQNPFFFLFFQWALEQFETLFKTIPDATNNYLNQSGFVDQILKQGGNVKEILEQIKSALGENKPKNIQDCIQWARNLFQSWFVNDIKQLLYQFPADSLTSSGQKFWSGPKRLPNPAQFDCEKNQAHFDFIKSATALHAFTYQIPFNSSADLDKIIKAANVNNLPSKDFLPKDGIKIETDEKATKDNTAKAEPVGKTCWPILA